MKLRIDDAGLRFRLDREDLRRLAETGRLSRSLHFGSGDGLRFTYSILADPGVSSLNAEGVGTVLQVRLPLPAVRALVRGEESTFTAHCGTTNDPGVTIRVETDAGVRCPARATGIPCPLLATTSPNPVPA